MSIVSRPFVLDFAGACLHQAPKFSEEIWSEWEAETRYQRMKMLDAAPYRF